MRDLIPRDDGHVGIYACADRLRDELRARGWEVRDGPDGPELVRIEQ